MIRKKKYVFIFVGTLLSLTVLAAWLINNSRQRTYVIVGKTKVWVTLARTNEEKQNGLSGKPSLGQNEGMLFVYERPGNYGIWMKDMLFAIDIIWIDENFKIIYIKESASPKSYPLVFYPTKPAQYILEVNSGFAQKHGIQTGNTIKGLESLSQK